MGIKSNGGGEIVQVQGGHIIRATGRKDRHSKVFTAKGPRDRRVRLSAHTAIQFYDVQDRLGYDRPSKAVDWLIKNAKASIDKLAELPPWDPISGSASTTAVDGMGSTELPDLDHTGTSYHHHQQLHISNAYVPNEGAHDSMKSFFPTTSEDNPMSFQSYPHDLISRGSNQNQDLCLSLHSFQDPGSTTHQTHDSSHDQALFQGSGSLGFDGGPGGWAEQQHHQDMGRFTRLMGWAGGGGGGCGGSGGEGRGGILFNPSLSWPPQAYSQRGTLQSSFAPLVDHHTNHHHQHHSSISGNGIGSDGFMGFCFPTQIHGELHGGASSSSLSPDSSQH